MEIKPLHEEVYQALINTRISNPNLRFTFRKSNHGGKLEDGYWFYGNDQYLAISFWTGMDWKNRTPNIIFIFTDSEKCFLEVNVSDSDSKKTFVEKYLVKELALIQYGRKYRKEYSVKNSLIDTFINFIHTDKLLIDKLVNIYLELKFFNDNTHDEAIGFISATEFNKRHSKIKYYQSLRSEQQNEEKLYFRTNKPYKLYNINIKDYGLIENLELGINSTKNQWVFLTGNNGSGKTNILRSIATVLGHRTLTRKELQYNPNFSATATLSLNDVFENEFRSRNSNTKGKRRPLVQGLAMYGPYRLDVAESPLSRRNLQFALSKEGSFRSLFNSGIPLLGINDLINIWQKDDLKGKRLLEKRKYYLISVLTDIVPNLVDVWFNLDNSLEIDFVFKDESGPRHCIQWNNLPSGIKSTIALLVDILIRFYDQQRDIDDPSEFKGIVIIDEIDLHLHPQGQKDLVVNLTKTFPNIQFIVTTHSPIPLLGAPPNSEFFKVIRDYRTVSIKHLSLIKEHLKELLPNHLFTSELFDLESIRSVSAEEENIPVYTGSTITSYIEYNRLKAENKLKDPDNESFIEQLKAKLSEKGKKR